MGAVAGCPITAAFDGDASLRSRPMKRVLDPLERMGAKAQIVAEGGRLPLTLQGARDPLPIVYEPPAASAQLKSAVLLAALSAPGETTVLEKEATRDHTEKMLAHYGAQLSVTPHGRAWPPRRAQRPAGIVGDFGARAGRSVLRRVSDGRGADRCRAPTSCWKA